MNVHPIRLSFSLLLMLFTAFAPFSAPGASQKVPAPDFELPDLAGTTTKLSAHRGNVVVLNFWATWCPECVIEIPSLGTFSETYRGKGVTVLSVSIDRSKEALQTFLEEHSVQFPVLLDPSGDVFVTRYRTRALPATVIVDQQGNIVERLAGRQDFLSRSFTKRIEELLKEGK